MKKYLQKKLNNEKGMTLIELLAVIVILAIIAAIAIPAIGNIIENSRVGAIKSDYVNALAAADLYMLDNPKDQSVSLQNLTGATVDTVASGGHEGSGGVFLDDAGSLTEFIYNPSARTFTGTGVDGSVTIVAGAGSTKEDISSIGNSDEQSDLPSGSTITLTR